MNNYTMGNSSEKIRHLMEISEEPPQRIRRRKSSAQSENSPETSQLTPKDTKVKTNGIADDIIAPKPVTFHKEKQCRNSSIPANPTLLQAASGSEAAGWNTGSGSAQTTTESEIKNLKDLVILHLDIVQQQQSIIAEKDKQIADLREETKALKTRLERMDRRLTVAKTVTPSPAADHSRPQSKGSVENTPSTSKISKAPQVTAAADGEKTHTQEKPVKASTKKAKLQILTQTNKEKVISNSKTATRERNKPSIKRSSRRLKTAQKDGLLRVSSEYYTDQVQEYEELAEEIIPNSQDTQVIEVPSFRTHTYSNCYNLEGTEDIDDQTFLKRHQRHENDEKKRKRWDLQRQREVQMIQKLKQSQTAAQKLANQSQQKEKQVDHIFPKAELVEQIEICDKLPVNVFGYPLPAVTPSEFALPWYCPKSTSTTNSKGKKRAKTR